MIALAPPPPALPANAVAVVAQARAGHAVSVDRGEFQRALVQAAALRGRRSPPRVGGNGYGKLMKEAMGELLDAVWIRGQAAEMGIGVRPRQVERELTIIRREAFKDRAEYQQFLKEAHYTRRDVHLRLEVQMLSVRIQERVVEGIRGQAARNKAFSRFVREYNQRWLARTVCAPEYLVPDRCSNAPPHDDAPSDL